MTIQTQHGETQYRIDPYNPRVIQVQRKPGDRWRELCRRKTPDDAREMVLLLGRGAAEQEAHA